jgi:hypothetical protein
MQVATSSNMRAGQPKIAATMRGTPAMGKHSKRDQFYLFTMPDDSMCPVWVETFGADGSHLVAPMPYTDTQDAMTFLLDANPFAIVDEIDLDSELAEVRGWARTMPLEQIPA